MKSKLQKPDWEELQQIPLGLTIDETEPGVNISPEEARLRSEAARSTLEQSGEQPEWYKRYAELRAAGWSWRVACYIAWASCPMNGRNPKTQDELARQVLGLNSDRQIWVWRKKNPAIDETVAVFQAAPLFEHRSDLFEALWKSGTSGDYKSHNDRKLAFEMMGDFVPRMKVETEKGKISDLGEISDEELERKARLAQVEDDDPVESDAEVGEDE
ncbi:MAG: hypothetical protein IMZ62_07440 [Chloroflexi bacterium]|nr:hypothetical protein [Chloroflexota bacterium]